MSDKRFESSTDKNLRLARNMFFGFIALMAITELFIVGGGIIAISQGVLDSE